VRPAAFCGVVGFKPSFGSIIKEGVHPFAYSLDHIGFFTRSVEDAAFAFQLLKDGSAKTAQIAIPDLKLAHAPKIALLKTRLSSALPG
jgi:Asp-tRNA(Asn)/Glu-tRNA(Gln) amidotransferase A subunit family amidase